MQKRVLFFLILLHPGLAVLAQNPAEPKSNTDSVMVYQAPELVVTATRVATPVDEIASSMSVISGSEIEMAGSSTLADVLRRVPGLSLANSGGYGRATALFLRGAPAEHTLVLLDGIELNDPTAPGNAFDFGSLFLPAIERVEVLRGPQSPLFGSNAIGGVIHILTAKTNANNRIDISGYGGSFDTFNGQVAVQGSTSRLQYSSRVRRFASSGFSAASEAHGNVEADGYRNVTGHARLQFTLAAGLNLTLSTTYMDTHGDLDQSGPQGDDPNFRFDSRQLAARAALQYSSKDGAWQHIVAANLTDLDRDTRDETDEVRPQDASHSVAKGQRRKLEWQSSFTPSPRQTLTAGIEIERESATSSFTSESAFGPFSSSFPNKSAITSSLFLQDQLRFAGRAFATLGIRYDRHTEFGGHSTYRLGLAYLAFQGKTRVKGTIGTGFNAPTLFEIFDPAFGNPNVKPEKSRGWDIGIEQKIGNGRLRFELAYFNNQFDDLIGFDENFRSINIDRAKTQGVETSLLWFVAPHASLRAGYTFTSTEDRSPSSPDAGKPLLRRPKHHFTANLFIKPQRLVSVNLDLEYTGKRDDKDFAVFPASRVTLDDFFLVHAGVNVTASQMVQVWLRLENLLDTAYEEVLYFGTPSRALFAGFRLQL